MNLNKEQVQYYKKRASEYEEVYQKPERQSDLRQMEDYLSRRFVNQSILEIACGTGYWTQILSRNTKSILATDINQEVLDIARKKRYGKQNVSFQELDIWELKKEGGHFDGLFGGFIWSHIPREATLAFLTTAVNQVVAKGELLFLDNKYVSGNSTEISRKDVQGNTYQKRKLSSGEEFEILKNFPGRAEMEALAEEIEADFKWKEYDYYWIAEFRKSSSLTNPVLKLKTGADDRYF